MPSTATHLSPDSQSQPDVSDVQRPVSATQTEPSQKPALHGVAALMTASTLLKSAPLPRAILIFEVIGPRPEKNLPHCYWPYFSTMIKYNGDVIPCCTHRQGMQYAPGADSRVFGNVFDKDFAEIWNSPEYQQARRIVSDPTRSDSEPALKNHFCDSCPILFETTRNENAHWADRSSFEDLYTLNEKGKPIRKAES